MSEDEGWGNTPLWKIAEIEFETGRNDLYEPEWNRRYRQMKQDAQKQAKDKP